SLAEHLLCDAPLPLPMGGGSHSVPAELCAAWGGAGGGRAAATAQRVRLLRGLSRELPEPLGRAVLGLARRAARALDAAMPEGIRADGPLLIVPAGDVAHVYSTQYPEPLDEEAVRARHPALLARCG